MSDLPTYVLERTFNAPKELVWRTWTEPDLLAKWYGPNIETVIHKLDVTPGGLWLNEMKWGENSNYQKMEYTEVTPPEKLTGLMSTTDADWNIISNPMMENWPKTLLTTVTLEETDGQTSLTLSWIPHEATDEEIACFKQAIESMGQGWNAGMQLLEELLAELQA